MSRHIDIEGAPVPKGRPRVYRGRAVTPQRTRDYEALVARTWRTAHPDATPLDGPVKVTITVSNANATITVEAADTPTVKRPRGDLDNIAKSIADALNGLGYGDDRQIVEMVIKVA